MRLDFVKMNGAGNDFVMLDNREGHLELSSAQIAHLCDRHRGIGADGVLILEKASKASLAAVRMRYYNADGYEAEMCGNGARCFTRYAAWLLKTTSDSIFFETAAGVLEGIILEKKIKIRMSDPHSISLYESLEFLNQRQEVHSINTGVPHAVVFVKDLEPVFKVAEADEVQGADGAQRRNTSGREAVGSTAAGSPKGEPSGSERVNVYEILDDASTGATQQFAASLDCEGRFLEYAPVIEEGRALRHHPRFAPAGTNVNFVEVLRPNALAIRTFERGVEDETLACGTGVVAAALVHHFLSKENAPISVTVRGKETLEVNFISEPSSNTELPKIKQVTLTGPAELVFEGTIFI